jgi:hypothetical protein
VLMSNNPDVSLRRLSCPSKDQSKNKEQTLGPLGNWGKEQRGIFKLSQESTWAKNALLVEVLAVGFSVAASSPT